jgi:hypothetical protein
VTALAVFFAAGSLIALVAAVSLLSGRAFEPIWRLNPRARTAFSGLASPLPPSSSSWRPCGVACVGILRRRRWAIARPWG